MLNSLALAAALWPAAITEHCTPQGNETVIGVALNARGHFLYCEHFSQGDKQQVNVKYTRHNAAFANKQLIYAVSPYAPSVNQVDQRTGEHRQAQVSPEKIQLSYQPGSDQKPETASLAMDAVDVIDAGFDHFVKAQWDDLLAGKSLAINFASIVHLKVLPLRIASLAAAKCSSLAEYCFSVEIDNSLLRLLAQNIKLSYDSNKRLQEFSGIVNLQDDTRKSQRAKIRYFYREDYLQQ